MKNRYYIRPPSVFVTHTVQAIIGGQAGSYVIDTGASTVMIESRTATQLGLQAVGKSLKAYGAAGCSTTVTPVRIDDWTAGGLKLPATIGVSSRSSVIDKFAKGKRIVGLIGANVLSTFGEVTLDFADSGWCSGGRRAERASTAPPLGRTSRSGHQRPESRFGQKRDPTGV